MEYFNLGIPGLCFPLMVANSGMSDDAFQVLIDFMGYRLQALSVLPIDRGTIIYGSADGGIAVVDSKID